jgi:hypothetical protein
MTVVERAVAWRSRIANRRPRHAPCVAVWRNRHASHLSWKLVVTPVPDTQTWTNTQGGCGLPRARTGCKRRSRSRCDPDRRSAARTSGVPYSHLLLRKPRQRRERHDRNVGTCRPRPLTGRSQQGPDLEHGRPGNGRALAGRASRRPTPRKQRRRTRIARFATTHGFTTPRFGSSQTCSRQTGTTVG